MDEITLLIDDEVFRARKEVLCEHSDYFRAMFSGNYKENNEKEIKIDIVDANSMRLLLMYMNNGLIDLSDVTSMNELAESAVFLQMSELIKQIEYTLICQLSHTNWLTTMALSDTLSSSKLEDASVAFGLMSFRSMRSEHIPSIHKLYWYLSHPYLDIDNELQVFKFGFNWVVHAGYSADALLVVLACLDLLSLTKRHFEEMLGLLLKFKGSLPQRMVDLLLEMISKTEGISVDVIQTYKQSLCISYTEYVYNEVVSLLRINRKRMLKMIPCVPIDDQPKPTYKDEGERTDSFKEKPLSLTDKMEESQFMYQYVEDKGFTKWLAVAPKCLWGWSVASWGRTKLVVVGGEYGKGTGSFMREVAVYDTLNKEWIRHGVTLPPRRHAGVAVLDNSLFIIGGVGTFRVVQTSCIIYDLEERSFRKAGGLPDPIQIPAVCAHNGRIYVSGHNEIYEYHGEDGNDVWKVILVAGMRANYMVSFEDYIYVSQAYFRDLYRFKPNKDITLEKLISFKKCVAAMCNAGRKLIVFTRPELGHRISVEAYENGKESIIWTHSSEEEVKLLEASGCCALVHSIPKYNCVITTYAKKYLALFPE